MGLRADNAESVDCGHFAAICRIIHCNPPCVLGAERLRVRIPAERRSRERSFLILLDYDERKPLQDIGAL